MVLVCLLIGEQAPYTASYNEKAELKLSWTVHPNKSKYLLCSTPRCSSMILHYSSKYLYIFNPNPKPHGGRRAKPQPSLALPTVRTGICRTRSALRRSWILRPSTPRAATKTSSYSISLASTPPSRTPSEEYYWQR